MAAIPYFLITPTAILALASLYRGSDETNPTPNEAWNDAVLDVVIPTLNEEGNIAMCLASLETQTYTPRKIVIIDDNSQDKTVEFAKEYIKTSKLNIELICHEKREGKTPSIFHVVSGDADAVMVLDADTFLFSNDYIETLMHEMQFPGIATVSGFVHPLHENDYAQFKNKHPKFNDFLKKHKEADYLRNMSLAARFSKSITNTYRDLLYLFLSAFIYKGMRALSGSIPNTIGCAAVYNRKLLKDVFDKYMPELGFNFTDAEDTFFGFAFVDEGYRNYVCDKVLARTQEPLLHKLPKQMFIWSSGFLQSCYYFNHLVGTAFKRPKLWFKKKPSKEILEQRKTKERYRQPRGEEYSKKYGRPIGWFIFTSTLEKITFPTFIVVMAYFGLWKGILLTLVAETILVSLVIAIVSKKGDKLKNLFKMILITPLRYGLFMLDFVILLNFIKDIIFGTKKSWRK